MGVDDTMGGADEESMHVQKRLASLEVTVANQARELETTKDHMQSLLESLDQVRRFVIWFVKIYCVFSEPRLRTLMIGFT